MTASTSPDRSVSDDALASGGPAGECDGCFCLHITPTDTCEHVWAGWREFEDGRGGERVCQKCGMGAMAHSLRYGL